MLPWKNQEYMMEGESKGSFLGDLSSFTGSLIY